MKPEALTLEEKVGQLLMIGFHGKAVDDHLRGMLVDRHVGGVIVFFRNIEDGPSLARLTSEIQAKAKYPLLLSADQEGGSVLRVRRGASLLPSAMGAGRLGADAARAVGRIGGREMRAMGINLNLAPVLEINHPSNPGIGIRAFGEDPQTVARCGAAYVQGLQEAGVLACAKHFPGKGLARQDAHLSLPVIDRSLEELESWELIPFRAAFEAGCKVAMTSHCSYPRLDDRPATISPVVLTELLRERLGFDGILITDDMEMGAILNHRDGAEASEAAFLAGADILLICADPAIQIQTYDRMLEGFRSGRLPVEKLDRAVERIARVKAMTSPAVGDIAALARENAPALDDIVGRIIEVARDPGHLLPLKGGKAIRVYWPDIGVLTRVEEGSVGTGLLKQHLATKFGRVDWLDYDPRDGKLKDGKAAGEEPTDVRLFFSANAHLFPQQRELLTRLAGDTGTPLVLVALRNPYDTDLVPSVTSMRTYGFLENVIRKLTDRL